MDNIQKLLDELPASITVDNVKYNLVIQKQDEGYLAVYVMIDSSTILEGGTFGEKHTLESALEEIKKIPNYFESVKKLTYDNQGDEGCRTYFVDSRSFAEYVEEIKKTNVIENVFDKFTKGVE
jgi:hypothetical protein